MFSFKPICYSFSYLFLCTFSNALSCIYFNFWWQIENLVFYVHLITEIIATTIALVAKLYSTNYFQCRSLSISHILIHLIIVIMLWGWYSYCLFYERWNGVTKGKMLSKVHKQVKVEASSGRVTLGSVSPISSPSWYAFT